MAFTILNAIAGQMNDGYEAEEAAARRLGEMIRRARSGRFTVQELARRAGIAAGSLSQIERGKGNPSFRTLQKIADALGLRIGDLVEAATSTTRGPMVVRRHERARLQVGYDGLIYELLTPNLRGSLEMLQTRIPPGFPTSPTRSATRAKNASSCWKAISGSASVTPSTTYRPVTPSPTTPLCPTGGRTRQTGKRPWWER